MSNYFTKSNHVFIIAEIGNNHNGNKETARKLIDIAAEAGVDAVKFQTFRGIDITIPGVKANEYKGWNAEGFEYWYQFLDSIALPLEHHKEVFEYANNKGLIAFSSPSSPYTVDFLEKLDVPCYKIASMDLTNVQLLKTVASTGKPVILSTGMGNDEEINIAIQILRNNELVLLHCISDYPTKPENVNLMAIKYLKNTFKVEVGLSDHSIQNEFAIGAVVLGASIIEKHITYNRNALEKAEHHFSLEPKELNELVISIRTVEKGLGEEKLIRSDNEKLNKFKFRRSLHVNKNLPKGHVLQAEDVVILRPNDGEAPQEYNYFIGQQLKVTLKQWDPLTKKSI